MSEIHHFLALDLGAESGRGIVVTLDGDAATMKEIHRFPNRPVLMGGTLYWDFPFLFAEVVEAIRRAGEMDASIESISVDTWGVDFGLLDASGALLSNPVNYRDRRTEGIHEFTDPIMDRLEIFQRTAYEPWQIASLFQLMALRRSESPLLEMAATFLNMPDLLLYFLTGERHSEKSIANTTNLMGIDGQWCEPILERFKLPKTLLSPLIEPATVVGGLREEIAEQTGLGEAKVIATCGHDTSAALAAVPAEGENWAFLSCGTWSILGTLIDQPVATRRCLELGFTNEYTIGGWYLARNISGLWCVQQLRSKWDAAGEGWDYGRMTAAAAEAESTCLFDAADESLLAPADMEEAILDLMRRGGAKRLPETRGEMVRAVLESLALEYNRRLGAIAELTGRRSQKMYMVGGGIANQLLCELTADACGMPVHAGADQCTAMGNALGQALALGILDSPQQIRDIMRKSFNVTVYQPRQSSLWQKKRAEYAEITG